MKAVWHTDGVSYQALHAAMETKIGALAPGTLMAVSHGGRLRGAALFNNYHPDSGVIELHAVAFGRRWLSRPILAEMFAFPFRQLGCQAVVMRADPGNTRVERIARAFGFKVYQIPRLRGRNTAENIFVLGDDDWAGNGFQKEVG